MTLKYALGIDVGGTKIEISVVSNKGQVLRTLREPTVKNSSGLHSALVHMIREMRGPEKITGIGFSIPGSLDPQTQILRNAPNSPEINHTDFFKQFAEASDLECRFENDANCLTLSEFYFGAARGYCDVVGVIMGTGLGGGVIHKKKLFKGARDLAPEIGHTPLNIFGRECLCGNQGCAEAYLSGPSILKRYQEAGGSSAISKTETLFENQDDPLVKKILSETRLMFSRFIAALTSMYDPQIIVLGGGLSLQNMFITCEDEIARYIFGSHQTPLIKQAELGDASGKLGAAALFF